MKKVIRDSKDPEDFFKVSFYLLLCVRTHVLAFAFAPHPLLSPTHLISFLTQTNTFKLIAHYLMCIDYFDDALHTDIGEKRERREKWEGVGWKVAKAS